MIDVQLLYGQCLQYLNFNGLLPSNLLNYKFHNLWSDRHAQALSILYQCQNGVDW